MTLKRIYNLKNQSVTYRHDNVSKMCVCILLVLLVICGIIGLTIFIVKQSQSHPEETLGQTNYHDVGNNEAERTNKKLTQHPGIKSNYLLASVKGRTVATSVTDEFTATTIESPLSTSTMSPKDVPTRFLIVNTFNTIDLSNTDYSSAGSTNDNVQFTTSDDRNSLVKRSTEEDFMNDAASTADDNFVKLTTEGEIDTNSFVKRSTVKDFMNDAAITTDENVVELTTDGEMDRYSLVKLSTQKDLLNDAAIASHNNFIDKYLQWTSSIASHEEKITVEINTETPRDKDKYTTTQQQQYTKDNSDQQTCTTNVCKQSAGKMLALVNYAAKPCEDFYSYACGGFDVNHFKEFTVNDYIFESLPDMWTLDVSVPCKKLYRNFFISCTNYKNGRGLMEISKLLYDLCQDHKNSLTDLIADIMMIHPQKTLARLLPLFDVVMEVGPENTMIPIVSLPKLNSVLSEVDGRDLYERSCLSTAEMMAANQKNKTIIQEEYKACIQDQNEYFKNLKKSILLLQIFNHLPDFRKEQKIQETLQFIEQNIIDKIGSISDDDLNNAEYETVAVNWLNSAYPKIEWNRLFGRLFGNEVAKNITQVRMIHSAYLVKIFTFYNGHSFEQIKTSILSMMAHDMYMDFMEPHSSNDRYRYCSNIATKLMPDIASKLYLENLRQSDISDAEQKLKVMFDQLIETFNASLNENISVNDNVRKALSNKIAQLNFVSNPYVGTDFVNFEENYKKLYREVNISTYDYISNVFALKQVVRRRMYATYGKSAMSPDIIWNNLASPVSNSLVRITETTTIVVPTSLIARFMFNSQKIEQFSTIGFLVAQEIARFLYTDKASKLFVANVEIQLKDPAFSKRPNIFGIQLNATDITASQHFRLIDEVALRVTYDAYYRLQSQFDQTMPWTNDSISKVFYVLTSQQFCNAKMSTVEVAINLLRGENLPNYFRVNSMMVNSKKFLTAFECQN